MVRCPKYRVLFVVAFGGLVPAASGCGQTPPPATPAGAKVGSEDRRYLVERLVRQAEVAADNGDAGQAEAHYTLAALYTDDPAVAAGLARLRPPPRGPLTPAQAKRFDAAVALAGAAAENWPDPPERAEAAELRILLSDYLRDHRRRRVEGPPGAPEMEAFVAVGNEPVHLNTLEKEFGPPTSREGNRVLTYGRLRFVIGPDLFSAAVYLQPVKRR